MDYNDGSESFKKPDYNFVLNNKRRVLDSLKDEKAKLENELVKLDDKDADYIAKNTAIDGKISDKTGQIKIAQNEYIAALNDPIIEAQKRLVFYYFNLRTMKSEKIENIDANILREERFKYILVDDNNNKLPYDETGRDLIKFTKIYSMLKIIAKSYSYKENTGGTQNYYTNTILLYYCRLNGYSRKSRKKQFWRDIEYNKYISIGV